MLHHDIARVLNFHINFRIIYKKKQFVKITLESYVQ